jgi:CheY-like chemotaxis protein
MSRILYVEDNFQNYRLVMRMLAAEKDRAYEICQAPDGESALRMVGEFQPDLILMDINLPDYRRDGGHPPHQG